MNKLSWLIYWADTIPHLANWLCVVAFLLFVICLLGLGGSFVAEPTKSDTWEHVEGRYQRIQLEDTEGYRVMRLLRRVTGVLAPLFFVLWGASFMVPEKNTFYMIAASEAGEQAMQTPEFVKVRKVIDKWLDDNSGEATAQTNDKKD